MKHKKWTVKKDSGVPYDTSQKAAMRLIYLILVS